MGFAPSLRGLAFHKHQANMNEVVIGRKLWMIFPPRSLVAEPHAPCPWPPWEPDGKVKKYLYCLFHCFRWFEILLRSF